MNRLISIVFVLIASLPIATASYSEDRKPNRMWACEPVLDGSLFLNKWFRQKQKFLYEEGHQERDQFYVKLYKNAVQMEWVDSKGSSLGKPLIYNVGTQQMSRGPYVSTLTLYDRNLGFTFERTYGHARTDPSISSFEYTFVELIGSRFWRTVYSKNPLTHEFRAETANCIQIL